MDQNISPEVTPEVEGVSLTAASWVAVGVIATGIMLFWSGIAAALTG